MTISHNIQTKKDLIDLLNQLNARFYARMASSFASTRHNSWPGWEAFIEHLRNDPALADSNKPLRILDLACGNRRFESYLEDQFSDTPFEFVVVDNCDSFPEMPLKQPTSFHSIDLINALIDGSLAESMSKSLGGETSLNLADIVVSFAFLHHIPSEDLRMRFMESMIESVRPGGYICVSLWKFLEEESLSLKAQNTTEQASRELGLTGLEPGDCILGWQNEPNTYRYCHSFSDDEIDTMISRLSTKTVLIDRYSADGRSGNLNTYLVLKRL